MANDFSNEELQIDEPALSEWPWFAVSFAIRCARRIQPQFHAQWVMAHVFHEWGIERTIRHGLRAWRPSSHHTTVHNAYAEAARIATDDGIAAAAANAARNAADAARDAARATAAAREADHANRLDGDRAAHEAARQAAYAARSAARDASRTAVIPFINADIRLFSRFSERKQDRFKSQALPLSSFGPLWPVRIGEQRRLVSSLVSRLEQAATLNALASTDGWRVVGYAVRVARRVQYLVDFDPDGSTDSLVQAIWIAENVAWDVAGARTSVVVAPGPLENSQPEHTPGGLVAALVMRTAGAALRSAVAAISGGNPCPDAAEAAHLAVEAATAADGVSGEAGYDPDELYGTHKESVAAGIGYDLWKLATAEPLPETGDRVRTLFGPLWEFATDPDLGQKIGTLIERFTPRPQPLLLKAKHGVRAADQRRVEEAAVHLIGTPEGARSWLMSPNPDLGGRKPADFLTEKHLWFLEEFIRSSDDGGYG